MIIASHENKIYPTYVYASLCNYSEARLVYCNKVFIDNEFFLVMSGDFSPIMCAGYFGKLELAQLIE